jgi:hypothetical protein
MRFRAEHLRPHGWRPLETLHIPDWRGCTTDYLLLPDGTAEWQMVPIWDPGQTANPLRQYEPAAPR